MDACKVRETNETTTTATRAYTVRLLPGLDMMMEADILHPRRVIPFLVS